MVVLALVVGIFGGLGSIVFSMLIGLFYNLFHFGVLSISFDANSYTAALSFAPLIILIPIMGSFIVTWITYTFAPEARGHGVPEVMNAIYYKEGHIRPVVVLAKAITSAISIGTGGSVGREGPIIQIGSAFGSVLGQWITMPTRQRVVLVAAGAAAGIAGTFNAPLGGMAFAMELMLVSVSARSVALVAMASVTATYISRLYHGSGQSFDVPELVSFANPYIGLLTLALCIPLGLIIGVTAAGFLKSIYWFEDRFNTGIGNPYLRHATGMGLLGLLLYILMETTGQYYAGGVGYAFVLDVLRQTLTNPVLLLALFAAKLLATGLTLGSGASGGIFSPSLFLGAALGAAFGQVVNMVFPGAQLEPAVFAIAGMAAMVGGSTGAVLTAIVMIFEQTRDYGAILPTIITTSLAHVARERLSVETIYTLKLARRGLWLPKVLQASTASARRVESIMSTDFEFLNIGEVEAWQATHTVGKAPRHTIIVKDGKVVGMARDELRYLLRDKPLEELVDSTLFFVTPDTLMPVLLRGMRAKKARRALVLRQRRSQAAADVLGVVTNREVFQAVQDRMDLME